MRTTEAASGSVRRWAAVWAAGMGLFLMGTTGTQAVDPAVRGRGESFISLDYLGETSLVYPQAGVRYTVHDTGLLNLGLNGNIDEHWSVGFDMGFGITEFEPNRPIVPGEFRQDYLRGDGLLYRLRINVNYNLLDSPITPFLTGGIGMLVVSSEDEDAGWGWYDGHYHDDYGWYYDDWGPEYDAELAFLFGVGGGIRWDVSDEVYLKLGGRADWAVFTDAENPVLFPTGYFEAGLKF